MLVAAVVLSMACDASNAPTAPPRTPGVAHATVSDGPTVHLLGIITVFASEGSRLIVTSYEPLVQPAVIGGITFVAWVRVVHPENGYILSDVMTDTPLDLGSMLIAQEVPPVWPRSFKATLVVRGPSD
jgi:hypothetical protein